MTAEAVKASFNKLSVEGHPGHNPRLVALLGIVEIEVVDPLTLTFQTEAPNSAFLWSLTAPSATVLKEGTDAMPIIGTAPFVFDMAETDKTYQVTGFADYSPALWRLQAAHTMSAAIPTQSLICFLRRGAVSFQQKSASPFMRRFKRS